MYHIGSEVRVKQIPCLYFMGRFLFFPLGQSAAEHNGFGGETHETIW